MRYRLNIMDCFSSISHPYVPISYTLSMNRKPCLSLYLELSKGAIWPCEEVRPPLLLLSVCLSGHVCPRLGHLSFAVPPLLGGLMEVSFLLGVLSVVDVSVCPSLGQGASTARPKVLDPTKAMLLNVVQVPRYWAIRLSPAQDGRVPVWDTCGFA